MNTDWLFTSASQFDVVSDQWNELNNRFAKSPLLCSTFFSELLSYYGDGEELVAICQSDDSILACAILVPKYWGAWETFAPAQAPIGAWLQNPDVPVAMLLKTLCQAMPERCWSIGLTRQDPIFLPYPQNTPGVSTMDYITTGRITAEGSFEVYWGGRGKNLRQNMNRQRNKLSREGISVRLEAISEQTEVERAVDMYGRLESQGWKAKSGTALHPDNQQGKFYKTLLQVFSRDNGAIVYQYYYNETLVATELHLQRGDTMVLLKTTHDERQKASSPTLLMRQDIMRRVFDEKRIKYIEFYGKKTDWHARWIDDFRVMYHINYDCWRVLSWFRVSFWKNRLSKIFGPGHHQQ